MDTILKVPISIFQQISEMGVDCSNRKDRRTGRRDKYLLFVIAVLSTFFSPSIFSYAALPLDVSIFFHVFILNSIVLNRNAHKVIHNLLLTG
jgi:hypothetical protein